MSDRACNGYSGTTSAIALTMIPEVDANNNLAIGAGTADYKGYQAVAGAVGSRAPASFSAAVTMRWRPSAEVSACGPPSTLPLRRSTLPLPISSQSAKPCGRV